jgi:serine phosphatase RsbU (regulator of sigma subunit)
MRTANDHRAREFGKKRLREAAAADPTANAQQVLEAVMKAVKAFTDNIPPSDDLTLFVIRRRPLIT